MSMRIPCATREYIHMHRREILRDMNAGLRYIVGQVLICVGILMPLHYAALRVSLRPKDQNPNFL